MPPFPGLLLLGELDSLALAAKPIMQRQFGHHRQPHSCRSKLKPVVPSLLEVLGTIEFVALTTVIAVASSRVQLTTNIGLEPLTQVSFAATALVLRGARVRIARGNPGWH